jgi:hypothetical protein
MRKKIFEQCRVSPNSERSGVDSARRRARKRAKLESQSPTTADRTGEMEICHCADSEIGQGLPPMQSHGIILSELENVRGGPFIALVAPRAT